MSLMDLRPALEAIAMDNTMAKDALAMKNLSALKVILERQENELKQVFLILEYSNKTKKQETGA